VETVVKIYLIEIEDNLILPLVTPEAKMASVKKGR